MLYFTIPVNNVTVYFPVPVRGILKTMTCVACTAAVEPDDTVIAYRDGTAINTWTAVNTAGLVAEDGVADATNKDLVFDPDSGTASDKLIKFVSTGAPGLVMVTIGYDPYGTIPETPALA